MRILTALGALGALTLLSSCEQQRPPETAAAPVAERDPAPQAAHLLDVLQENPEFSVLAQMIDESGLSDRLAGAEPLTVFAPTNTAFEKLPAEERRLLGQADGRERLRGLLAGHMTQGGLTLDQIADQASESGETTLVTLEGARLTLREDEGRWVITDENGGASAIAMPDVRGANGVIHAVDTVIGAN